MDRPWTRCVIASGSIAFATLMVAPVAQAASQRRQAEPAFSIRLEDQILATLRYLPVSFKPTVRKITPPTTTTTTTTTTITTTTNPVTTTTTIPPTTTTTIPPTTTTTAPKKTKHVSPTKLQKGTFPWRFNSLPSALRALWRVGTNNVVLQGALMRFQSVQGMITTGAMDGATWTSLVHAALSDQRDPMSYNDVVVDQALPEKLKLYQNGKVTFVTLVNTGVASAPTENGTYPVYVRYVTTTMSGFYSDGSSYSDPGIPWVSYFHGGDALHGFIRSSYGFPQSLGCVEMPFVDAQTLWPHTPIGTLVTVQ